MGCVGGPIWERMGTMHMRMRYLHVDMHMKWGDLEMPSPPHGKRLIGLPLSSATHGNATWDTRGAQNRGHRGRYLVSDLDYPSQPIPRAPFQGSP